MEITIHRGTQEIGGTCVEMRSGGKKIIIDAGTPLSGEETSLPVTDKVDAVFISHPHQDHFGLIEQLNKDIPVYIGKLGQELIQATRIFLGKETYSNNFKNFTSWKPVSVGKGITVTPYPVDHSAPDAYGFLIEADGKRVFYSGDFRRHGRKQKLFDHILQRPPCDVDLLLMEGTMLERGNTEFPDEKSVEAKIVEALRKESGPAFLLSSSQNIDRIVSSYKAALRTGRLFVVDIYTAWILNEIGKHSDGTPRIDWNGMRVLSKGYTAKNHYLRIKNKPGFEEFITRLYKSGNVITHDELAREPGKYFIKNSYIDALLRQIRPDNSTIIYSMWQGLLQQEHNPRGYKRFLALKDDPKINFVYAHTSGHAIVEDLKRFADAIAPQAIIPIHTEHGDKYSECFEQKIQIIQDGQSFRV